MSHFAPTRRTVLAGLVSGCASMGSRTGASTKKRQVRLISAPSNLGLRPQNGREPGTWQAPAVLFEAGLAGVLAAGEPVLLARPPYSHELEPGSQIRNGRRIRAFTLELAAQVEKALRAGDFPVVIGGDCSIALGCLLGLRRAGGRGFVHIDGHSDFFHPGNYDAKSRPGTAAGMDLALATGRGEPLLTQWPDVEGPLATDIDTVHLGERDTEDPQWLTAGYPDVLETQITHLTVQHTLRHGIAGAARQILARLETRGLDRVWVHVDLDVLDESVLPAVDSPGSPGLSAAQLAELGQLLVRSGRVAGVDFAIYDPALDEARRYPAMLVEHIAQFIG